MLNDISYNAPVYNPYQPLMMPAVVVSDHPSDNILEGRISARQTDAAVYKLQQAASPESNPIIY